MLSIILLAIVLAVPTSSFVGYDCHDHLSTTIYSAIDPPDCTPPNLQWTSTSIPTVSILQVPLEDSIHVSVVQGRSKTISYYCSYERHFMPLLFPSNFLDMSPMTVPLGTASTLIHAATHGESFQGKTVLFDQWISYHNSRDVDSEGYCKSWKSKGEITITAYLVQSIQAKIQYSATGEPKNTIVWGERLPVLSPNIPAYLRDGSVVLSDKTLKDLCELELIYSGPADYVLTKDNQLFLVVDSIATGLLIGGKTEVCGVPVSTTSATSVLVTNQTVPGKTVRGKLETVHWSAYIQSIVQYEALHLTQQMVGSDNVLSANQCELERMVYSNILFGAKTDPDHTGLRIMGEPGWSVRVAGAAIHIFKCAPVALKIVPQPSCFSRIPVSSINSSIIKYLDPSSYSLHSNSTSVDCSDPLNPFFKVRGSWYKLTPDLHSVPPPLPLPSRMELLNTTKLTPTTGLYPHEVLLNAEQKIGLAERSDHARIALIENYEQISPVNPQSFEYQGFSWSSPVSSVLHSVSNCILWIWVAALTVWLCIMRRSLVQVNTVVHKSPESVPLHAL